MISQFLYNLTVSVPERKLVSKIFMKIVSLARGGVIKLRRDPLIKYPIGQYTIKMPLSHQLGFYRKQFPAYASNVARVARLVKEKYPEMSFIDIGANVGDTIAFLRTGADFPILAIEGEDRFYSILQENIKQFPDVEPLKAYVGESSEKMEKRFAQALGSAHLVDETGDTGISTQPLPELLETRPRFRGARMLKIDTDGFDNNILRGAMDWLSQTKPVLFFEYDPFFLEKQGDDGLSIFSALAGAGYGDVMAYHSNGDYMFTADIGNRELLVDLHFYFSGRGGNDYCDLCVFPARDKDLFNRVRASELEFFKKQRS